VNEIIEPVDDMMFHVTYVSAWSTYRPKKCRAQSVIFTPTDMTKMLQAYRVVRGRERLH